MTLSLTNVLLSTLAPVLLTLPDSTAPRPSTGSGASTSTPAAVAIATPTPGSLPGSLPGPLPTPRPAEPMVTVLPLPFAKPAPARTPASLAVPAARAVNTARRSFGIADSIIVEKAAHRLTLYRDGFPVVSYSVALGKSPVGPKLRAGDNRTPEGLYYIDARNPSSRFHLGLHVSYPNAADRARAQALGVPVGGDIMIHGLPNGQGAAGASHRQYDWTNGCVAVTDEEIEEIWESVPVGTPIRILP